jgi:hypothetical protein
MFALGVHHEAAEQQSQVLAKFQGVITFVLTEFDLILAMVLSASAGGPIVGDSGLPLVTS